MRIVKRDRDGADDLYATPPAEFIHARDALAKRLRAEGKTTDAARVQRLRKPTLALWALNRAVRTTPAHVRAFLDALARVRRAQLRTPDELTVASNAMRTSLAQIVADARSAIEST